MALPGVLGELSAWIDQYFLQILVLLTFLMFLNLFFFTDAFRRPKAVPFLNPNSWQPLALVEKRQLTHNTRLLRFALPSKTTRLGLPTGQHISFSLLGKDGKEVYRPYTPISDDVQLGSVDFVIKVYPTGKMTPLLDELAVGDTVQMKGPRGRFVYKANMKREIGMVAGGTGITPMYQVAQAILRDKRDRTKVSLVYANVTEDDIILRSELDALQALHPTRFKVYYVLNSATAGWAGGVGFVTADIIAERLAPPAADVLVLLCGPGPMNDAVKRHLGTLMYKDEAQFQF